MASLIDVAPEELSIVCFRYAPDHLHDQEEQLDALNKRFMEEVQTCGLAFVNGTLLRDRLVLRSCALHYRLTEADVEDIFKEAQQVGQRCPAQSS